MVVADSDSLDALSGVVMIGKAEPWWQCADATVMSQLHNEVWSLQAPLELRHPLWQLNAPVNITVHRQQSWGAEHCPELRVSQ